MLELSLVLEHNAGPFIFGEHINATIQKLEKLVPKEKKQVEFGDGPIVVSCPSFGLTLTHGNVDQCLLSVSISEPAKVALTLQDVVFSGPYAVLTFSRVLSTLGPTFQGSLDEKRGLFWFSYPGMLLGFGVPLPFANPDVILNGELPPFFPDGTEPLLAVVKLAAGFDNRVPRLPAQIPSLPKAISVLENGIDVQGTVIRLGEPRTHVLMAFGSPSSTFDPQGIVQTVYQSSSRPGLLYLNYPELGVDFGILDNKLDRIILHSNCPNHWLFGRYTRANFHVRCNSQLRVAADGTTIIRPTSLWPLSADEAVTSVVPVIHRETLGDAALFFGSSRFFIVDRLVFEVLADGAIASLTLLS